MRDQILANIREAGVQEENVEKFYSILSEEVLEVLFKEISEKSTDDELSLLENRMREAKSTEHFETIIKEIAVTLYGETTETEIMNIYLDLIDSFKQTVDEAKALVERANSGDSQAQELLEKVKETEEYQNITSNE